MNVLRDGYLGIGHDGKSLSAMLSVVVCRRMGWYSRGYGRRVRCCCCCLRSKPVSAQYLLIPVLVQPTGTPSAVTSQLPLYTGVVVDLPPRDSPGLLELHHARGLIRLKNTTVPLANCRYGYIPTRRQVVDSLEVRSERHLLRHSTPMSCVSWWSEGSIH